MANNLLQFSEGLPNLTANEAAWLEEQLQAIVVCGDREFSADDSAIATSPAARKIKWRDGPPVIVGCYNSGGEEEVEESSFAQVPSVIAPEDREQAIQNLFAKIEAAGLEPEDLDEAVHEAVDSVAADINNRGLDGQLAYLIGQWGGAAVAAEIERLAADKSKPSYQGANHGDTTAPGP